MYRCLTSAFGLWIDSILEVVPAIQEALAVTSWTEVTVDWPAIAVLNTVDVVMDGMAGAVERTV